jgi:hypothetical protein
LNVRDFIINEYGAKKSNPETKIFGNKKSGYKFGEIPFSENQKIIEFVK